MLNCSGIHAKLSADEKSGWLIRILYIWELAGVNLTCNVNVPFGLFKGAVLKVMDIVYSANITPKDGFPEFAMADFPKYCGPPLMDDHPTWIPVPVVEMRLDCQFCKRRQALLRPNRGTTIHRCLDKFFIKTI